MRRGEVFRRETGNKKMTVNPLWRGFGCIAMFLLPVVTFGLTWFLTPVISATGYIPLDLLGYVKFPDWTYRAPVLGIITSFIGGIKDLWLNILVFIVILIVLIGIFSLAYTIVMQVMSPPRYSEIDAPPSRYKAKKYTR
jgi:hypothetical protein